MKAMILAAGLGERLFPLTKTTPKPLLKLNRHYLIENHLHALKKSGIEQIVINVARHAAALQAVLGDGEKYGVNIQYSYEGKAPLETGGGIRRALPLLGEEPFILVSADIWTDYEFTPLTNQQTSDACLVMVPNPDYHQQGDYGLNQAGFLTLGVPKYTYSNIALLHPRIFATMTKEKFQLNSVLQPLVEQQRVKGKLYHGVWFNVGSYIELARARSFANTRCNQ